MLKRYSQGRVYDKTRLEHVSVSSGWLNYKKKMKDTTEAKDRGKKEKKKKEEESDREQRRWIDRHTDIIPHYLYGTYMYLNMEASKYK